MRRFRPFELVASGFTAVDAGPSTPSGLGLAETGPVAPFAAVEVRVEESAGADGHVRAGLATADGDHLLVGWSAASRRVSLELRSQGRTRRLRWRKTTVQPPFGLAFALCENQVTALVDEGDGWRPVLTERARVLARLDLRRPELLGRFRYAWGGDEVALASVRAGLFGMTGLRDPHLVQHADGTPYERDGRYFLTWTCAGLGFFPQAHWTVWSHDPAAPHDMRLESQLFTRRDGMVLGDHAGQLVRDGDRWLVATIAWGDFRPGSIHVRRTETSDDLLSGVHLLETSVTPLPTRHGTWDPGMTRVDGRWQVSYVESRTQKPFVFHPALAATGSEDWWDGLEQVMSATTMRRCEGPVLARVGERTWLLASDRVERSYPVFELGGRRVGRLDAPYPTNVPHPQVVPDPRGGWWLITFNGTTYAEKVMGYGGHGDVVVMRAD